MSQIVDPPGPIEVNEFKFRQLRKVKFTLGAETVPNDAINLIAVSSRFGLLFVGFSGGFKVLKLENLLDLDEEADVKLRRNPSEQYSSQIVPCATPVLLSLSSDDMTLAVCTTKDFCPVADMYDVRAFANPETIPMPFLSVQLLSHEAVLADFMWNPVTVEMYAYCLSDGSLHVHEVSDVKLNIVAQLPASTLATSVCWSPKGKQVVVGKMDGSFSQYKPTLQEMKKIPPPCIGGISSRVINIHWLATTSFAVTYVLQTEENLPALMLVTTPKGGPITYSMFGDICLGFGRSRANRYLMHHQSEWGILMCSSANAVETGVIGNVSSEKSPSWVQWMLEDGGRAEIPLDRDTEAYPLGLGVIFCAQRKIIISESEFYPPMPILFLLSTSGMLCPFHILNLKPGSANLTYPSEPISCDGERKSKESLQQTTPRKSLLLDSLQQKPPPVLSPIGSFVSQQPTTVLSPLSVKSPLASNIPAFGAGEPNATFSFGRNEPNSALTFGNGEPSAMPAFGGSELNAMPAFGRNESISAFSFSKNEPITPVSFLKNEPVPNVVAPFAQRPAFSPVVPQGALTPPNFRTSLSPSKSPVVVLGTQAINSSPVIVPLPKTQPEVEVISSPDISFKARTPEAKKPDVDDAQVISMIISEIQSFEDELSNINDLCRNSQYTVGTKEELTEIKKNSLIITDFHNDMKETMQSLNNDIHLSKTASLESFAMVGEANSRNVRRNDPKYAAMVRERALDPISAKSMQNIKQHYHYLSSQLHEVHDKLDRDWVEYMENQKNKKRNRLRIPSSQAVYQTVVNNQKTIHNLKYQLEDLSEEFSKLKVNKSSRSYHLQKEKSFTLDGDLSKLADSLLQDKSQDISTNRFFAGRKKLPPDVQNTLRNILINKPVTCVRPKPINMSCSQLLSSRILHSEFAKKSTKSSPVVKTSVVSSPVKVPPSPPPRVLVESPVPFAVESAESVPKGSFAAPSLELKPLSAFSFATNQTRPVGRITEGTPVVKPVPNVTSTLGNSMESTGKSIPFFTPATASTPSSFSFNFSSQEVPKGQNPAFNWKPSNFQTPKQSPSIPSSSVSSFSTVVPIDKSPRNISVADTTDKFNTSVVATVVPTAVVPPISQALAEPLVVRFTNNVASVLKRDENLSSSISSSFIQSPTSPFQNFAHSKVLSPSNQQESAANVFVISSSSEGQTIVESVGTIQNTEKENIENQLPTILNLSSKSALQSADNVFQPPNVTIQKIPVSPSTNILQPSAFVTNQTVGKISVTDNGIFKQIVPTKVEATSTVSDSPKIEFSILDNSYYVQGKDNIVTEVSDSQNAPETKSFEESAVDSSSKSVAGAVSSSDKPALTSNEAVNIAVTTTSPFFDQKAISGSSFFGSIPGFSTTTAPSDSTQKPAVSSSSSSFFGTQSSFFNSPTSVFGQTTTVATSTTTTTTATTSVFGQTVTTTSSVFGQTTTAATTTTPSPFGQTATAATTTTPSAFGQTATTTPSVFGQTATTTTSVFGQTPSTTTTSVFGQTVTTTTSVFGQTPTTTSSSVFGQTATSTPSVFGQTANATTAVVSPFGQAPASPFGQTASPFGQSNTAGSSFGQGQTSSFFGGGSVFGQKDQQQLTETSVFGSGSPASGFSFNKTFEQTSPSSFGLAKAVFGQPASPSSPSFGQPTEPVFGQSSFFGGLGGKPSEQNASKNAFGLSGGSLTGASGNLFGNQGATVFGAKPAGTLSPSGGSFSGGGGSVAQSGFQAFQQTPNKTGFGGSPLFGTNPSFGGSPTFGSSPTFGGGAAQPTFGMAGGSAFGAGAPAAGQAGFSNFASTDSPTFGTLASQTGGSFSNVQQSPGFGQQQQQQPQQQQSPQASVFGNGGSLFGSASPPSFGSQQGFGSPSSNTSASAFSQWRS